MIYRYYKQKSLLVTNIPIVSLDRVDHSLDNKPRSDPVKQVFAQELKTAIEEKIAQLPPKAREAIRLKYIKGLSLKRSAEEAGCSVHTFCQRIVDAKEVLRKNHILFEDKL